MESTNEQKDSFYKAVEFVQSYAPANTTAKRDPTVFDTIKAGLFAPMQKFIEKLGPQCVLEPDAKGYSAAHWACLNGNMQIVRQLIELGVAINNPATEDPQSYPIHWACTNGHIAVVDLFIQMGVPIDIVDSKGCTPLIVACQYGQVQLAGYLMGKGAKIHLTDKDGDTALHWAAFKGHSELIKLLLYSGFSSHQKDNFGQTVLHLACINGSLPTVKILCEEEGLTLDAKDKNGKTPYMLAAGRKHTQVMEYLKDRLASQSSVLNNFQWRYIVFGPPGNSKQPLLFFMGFSLLWCYPLYFYKVLYISWSEIVIIHILFWLSNAIMWISLLNANTMDPGFIPKNEPEYDMAIKQVVHYNEWKEGVSPMSRLCHTCRIVKPYRSKHCRVCNRCVLAMDHHCPWIYNCVGYKNRVWFAKFCLSLACNLVCTLYFIYYYIYMLEGFPWWFIISTPVLLFACFQGYLLAITVSYQSFTNITTNESINWRRYEHFKDINGKYKNPFDRGPIKNFQEYIHMIPPAELPTNQLDSIEIL